MGFPTVKSDPWKARARRKASRRVLWTDDEWRQLVRQAREDDGTFDAEVYPISDRCLDLIAGFNLLLEREDS